MPGFDKLFSRRSALQLATAATASGWLGALARAAAPDPARKRACILL